MNKEEIIRQSVYEAIQKIAVEKLKYKCMFMCSPNYVKLPIALYVNLKAFNKECLSNFDTGKEKTTFCGLQLCPTRSIETIDEIEVF